VTRNNRSVNNKLTERQFQKQIVDLAQMLGWRVYYVPDSRRSPAGFPDIVLLKRGRLIFAELKTEKGRLRSRQKEWLNDLKTLGQGVKAFCWRPSNWEEIEETLR